MAQDFTTQWQYIENLKEELNAEEMNEVWDYYSQNQINLNKPQQLKLLGQLQLLAKNEIELIQNYCKQNQISSIYQLQTLDIPITSLRRIKVFITNGKTKEAKKTNQTSAYIGIQSQTPLREGNLNKEYTGSPLKTNLKYRQRLKNNWRLGLYMEKDIGEPMVYKEKGINNIGFNLQYLGLDKLKQIIIGKYDLSMGEGLIFDTRYRINSPYFLSYTNKTHTKPSLSPKEYNYFNGIAAEWELKNLSINLFSSYRKASGASNYDKTGLFRTTSEVENYKNFMEKLLGVSVIREGNTSQITWAGVMYNTDLHSKTKHLQSISYSKLYYNIQLTGELANQNLRYWAAIQKMNIGIGRNSFLTIQYRYRMPEMLNTFNSDYSAFSNAYENGIYYAFLHKLNNQWTFKLAFDTFKSTQVQTKAPHYPIGNKIFIEMVRVTDKSRFTCQYQYKKIVEKYNIQKLRTLYQFQINPQIRWSSKLYCISENKQFNTSIQENLNWSGKNKKSKISFSTCYFNTNNESVYWQAPHFYGLYNARFLSGKGSIYSLAYQKKLLRNFKIGLQAMLLNYTDREFIGTGNETTNSSNKLDIALYLKWRN